MTARAAAVVLAACALSVSCHRSDPKTAPSDAAEGATATGQAALASGPTGWLHVSGNKILLPNGKPFHGHGANVQDTRGCNACAYEPAHVDEVIRRVDMLVDGWHANFVRLLLECTDKPEGRMNWRCVTDDPDYVNDLKTIVHHIGEKPGVYVLVSLWNDPTFDKNGWPTAGTRAEWQILAKAFANEPQVLYGLVNEPEENRDGSKDKAVWTAMNDTVATIRATEPPNGPHHVISVQGTRAWARDVSYYEKHPITAGGGAEIAYEVHIYDPKSEFAKMLDEPSKKLPLIVGEYGPVTDVANMSLADCAALEERARQDEVPYLAYSFHGNCPPNLLEDNSMHSCGVGMPLEPTEWGKLVKKDLARPW